ncbi:hypothetical protein [Pseudoroseomonas cervicalis]|uniref:hypothetical protein n=1 Tax=Teichococcus cervicalis TaxID=204525 RepID=UPI0022F1C69B|nr:hypothetical protein [Pseudoroseomonas cervicalis]WBV42526.1 hypothetical protein PFY06_14955 [Pseudoroseomonas cervicalis]
MFEHIGACVRSTDAARAGRTIDLSDRRVSPSEAQSLVRRAIARHGCARRTASASHRAIVNQFPSNKMKACFAAESKAEGLVLVLADVLEPVRAFRPQAIAIQFNHDGRKCTAYPDIAVETTRSQVEFWECKGDREMSAAANARLKSLGRILGAVGITYRIVRPDWSRREPRASNANSIWRLADYPLLPEQVSVTLDALRDGAATLGELGRLTGVPRPHLLAIVAHGVFALNITSSPIGDHSAVRNIHRHATSGGCGASEGQDFE